MSVPGQTAERADAATPADCDGPCGQSEQRLSSFIGWWSRDRREGHSSPTQLLSAAILQQTKWDKLTWPDHPGGVIPSIPQDDCSHMDENLIYTVFNDQMHENIA